VAAKGSPPTDLVCKMQPLFAYKGLVCAAPFHQESKHASMNDLHCINFDGTSAMAERKGAGTASSGKRERRALYKNAPNKEER
jgi:hypothetical protein